MEPDIELHIENILTALNTPRNASRHRRDTNNANAAISLSVLARYARIGALRTKEAEVPKNIVNPVEYE